MAKFQPAALAVLGVLWLIRDLYAFENDRPFHPKQSDFYFEDLPSMESHPVPASDSTGNSPHRIMPVQPALSSPHQNDNQTRQEENENKDTKLTNNDHSGGKKNDNESTSKERELRNLLRNLIDFLLSLNNKEDSLIYQLTSYLEDEYDQPQRDGSERVETSSTMKKAQPEVTTFATTKVNGIPKDEDVDAEFGNDGFTKEIPQTSVTSVTLNETTNATLNPGLYHPNRSQARMPAVNNYKLIDIFQYQIDRGIVPSNEFIDDIINSVKNVEGETPNNSTEPKKKPATQRLINTNSSWNQENENSTKYPISMRGENEFDVPLALEQNERNHKKKDNRLSQMQTPSEEPWIVNPSSTKINYQIPFVPEFKPNYQNKEKAAIENRMASKLNFEPQISPSNPVDKQDFYPNPNSSIAQKTNYNKMPTNETNDNSKSSELLQFEKNHQPSKNMTRKNNRNHTTHYNKLQIRNSSLDVLKENKNANLSSTESASLIHHNTEVTKMQNTSTTEPLSPSIENNFYNPEIPETQKEASSFPGQFQIIRPFQRRIPNQPNKLNDTMPSRENQMNSTLELPSENKTNNSELSNETKENAPQKTIEDQQSTTEEFISQNNLTENTPQRAIEDQQSTREEFISQSNLTENTPGSTPLSCDSSTKSPESISMPLDSKQNTNAPEIVTQSTIIPGDLKETDSVESDGYNFSGEENSSDDIDEEEQNDTEEEEQDDAHDKDQEDTDVEGTVYGNTDDDTFQDINDADENSKISIINSTLEATENSSLSVLSYSTESPQNEISNLNSSVSLTNDFTTTAQNFTTPSTDSSNESLQTPAVPSTKDSNESTENTPVPPKDGFSKSSGNDSIPFTNYPTKLPRYANYDNKSSEHLKGPPYDSILDYVYSNSNSSFFRDLKKEQDKI